LLKKEYDRGRFYLCMKKNQKNFQVVTIRVFEQLTTFHRADAHAQVLENTAFICYIKKLCTINKQKNIIEGIS